MSRSRIPMVLTLAAIPILAGLLIAQEPPQPDGQPDIDGDWAGTLKWKGWSQSPGSEGTGRGKEPIDVVIRQNAASLAIDMTVHGDDGPRLWQLTGTQGNGAFWAEEAAGSADPMMLVVSVKKGKKLLGKGVTSFDGNVFEFRISAKRSEP